MGHEYFPVRIKKLIEQDARQSPEPTFNGGDFAPDLMNRLKAHLRKVEEAQIRAVQEYKEVVRTSAHRGGRLNNRVQAQIDAARKAQGV